MDGQTETVADADMSEHLPARTRQETAKQLGVSVPTIDRYLADGRLFSVKYGPNRRDPRRIPQSAIDAFIAARVEEARHARHETAPAGVRAPAGA